MEKARRSIRRSATRLISGTDESESDLNVALQEWKSVKNASSSFAQSQREAAEFLLKWSLKEDNRAIKDAAFQLNELVQLWSDAQARFSIELQSAIEELTTIREVGKVVKDAEKRVNNCTEKEEKIRKDLQAACRWRKGGDLRLLQHTLEQTSHEREVAEQRATETKLEQEAAKMLRFKKAMNILAQSYMHMGEACTLVFEAHRDISDQIPDGCDVGPTQLPFLQYVGAPFTRQRVEVVRRRMSEIVVSSGGASRSADNTPERVGGGTNGLQQRRRVSDTAAQQLNRSGAANGCFGFPGRMTAGHMEPPPPYAP